MNITLSKNISLGTGELDQWQECLLSKHKDLISDCSILIRSLALMAAGGEDMRTSGHESSSRLIVAGTVQGSKTDGTEHSMSSSSLHTCTHAYFHTIPYTHACAATPTQNEKIQDLSNLDKKGC